MVLSIGIDTVIIHTNYSNSHSTELLSSLLIWSVVDVTHAFSVRLVNL